MRSGRGHPDLAVYRLIKGGDSGLNLSLTDLFGREIEFPNLKEIIKSFFTKRPIRAKIRGFPVDLIERLGEIQKAVDGEIEKAISKAKSGKP
jgi:hypothetical protein